MNSCKVLVIFSSGLCKNQLYCGFLLQVQEHTYVKKGIKFFKTVRQFFHGLSKHFRRCIQIGAMYIYLCKVSIPTHVSSANYNSKDKKTCNILKMFLLQRSSPSCFAKKKVSTFSTHYNNITTATFFLSNKQCLLSPYPF